MSQFRWLLPLTSGEPADHVGAKASRLSAALLAGFPVLPGWVLPVPASRPAVRAAAAAIRADGIAAGRPAALSQPVEPALAGELEAAVARLSGRVIVRSSSPLESDPRWSGAFASVAEVGPAEAATAVRSCWAAAFAPDPLLRLELCGLPPEAAELAVLLQPEISPEAGGLARVACPPEGGVEVVIECVSGHPGALLAGQVDGRTARLRGHEADLADGRAADRADGYAADLPDGAALVSLVGIELARAVLRLALGIYRELGDNVIEWAVWRGEVWLLQSLRQQLAWPAEPDTQLAWPAEPDTQLVWPAEPDTQPVWPAEPDTQPVGGAAPVRDPATTAGLVSGPVSGLVSGERMLALAETVQARGHRLRATPAAPGAAAGRLIVCRQHELAPSGCRDAVLLVDRSLPGYAPLLFAARGVIARAGSAGSHLAGVARSLGVPMVVSCPVEAVTGADPAAGQWLVAMDGGTGDVAVLAADARMDAPAR